MVYSDERCEALTKEHSPCTRRHVTERDGRQVCRAHSRAATVKFDNRTLAQRWFNHPWGLGGGAPDPVE